MSGHIDDQSQCAALQDELTELALGILTGRARSEVLSHVASCERCALELERLSIVADSLLELAPPTEPPLGFELRLAERMGATPARRRARPLRRASMLGAAAAVAILLGFGLGAVATGHGDHDQGSSATANLTSAVLSSHGRHLGEILLSAGRPAWMFITVDADSWSGPVTCSVTLAGGQTERIGVFKLSGGYGAWGAPLHTSAGQVRSAQLTAANGTVLARAQLRA